MKQKTKDILGGVAFIAVGIFFFFIADDYVFMLFHVIPVNFMVVGGITVLLGIIKIVTTFMEKGTQKGKSATSSGSSRQPGKQAASRPAQQAASRAAAQTASRAAPQAAKPRAAAPAARKTAAPPRQTPTAQQAGSSYAAQVCEAARLQNTAEGYRNAAALLEKQNQANPQDTGIVSAILEMQDAYLRTNGDKTFQDHQQRFYSALRAVYMEENHRMPKRARRFWIIHNAVRAGMAAATAKDLNQLNGAMTMLDRAGDFRSELNRPVDSHYMYSALPGVRCLVAYWIARLCITQTQDYRRASQMLQLSESLLRKDVGLRVCDVNPYQDTNTKMLLTQANLDALKNQLRARVNG